MITNGAQNLESKIHTASWPIHPFWDCNFLNLIIYYYYNLCSQIEVLEHSNCWLVPYCSRPAVNLFQWFRLKIILQSWNLGKELHIAVHNVCVLARIGSCCADKDIQDGVRQPFWIILLFIKSTDFIIGKKNSAQTFQERSWTNLSSPESATRDEEQDIQDGVQPPFSIIVFIIKSLKFTVHRWNLTRTFLSRS